jgi:hypothetical protein
MPPGRRPREVRVGSLEASWDGGLRWVRFDGVEVLRGILLTARDADWQTLQPEIRRLQIVADADTFAIGFDVGFRGDRFGVDGRVAFEGDRRGRIEARFTARVVAKSVVQRLGLIVLHPAGVAGRPFQATRPSDVALGVFPMLVTAERFATGYRALTWEAADGLTASLAFAGDLWETEDQRAWTDASFKSYSPPLSRPHPVTLAAGATFETAIQMAVERTAGATVTTPRRRRRMSARVTVRDETIGPLPAIGLEWSQPLECDEVARLRELGPAHFRVILDRDHDDWRSDLDLAALDAAAVGTALQLEVVGFATGEARIALADALSALHVPVVDALAFGTADDAGLVTTEGTHVGELRRRLVAVVPDIVVGGGSRANYAELAAASLPFESLDAVAFAVTPQIHATDAATVIENLTTLAVLMHSAAALGGGRPLDILCSFRPRFDAYADPPERGLAQTRFDDRLAGDLGSAWLIGTLAGILAGVLNRVTVLEASGFGGVLTSDDLVATLAAVLAMRGTHVLRVETTDGFAALALRSDDRLRVIIANLRARATTVAVALPSGWSALDDATGRVDLAPLGHRVIDAAAV